MPGVILYLQFSVCIVMPGIILYLQFSVCIGMPGVILYLQFSVCIGVPGIILYLQFSVCIGVPGIILSLIGKYFPTIVLAYIIGMIFNGTAVYLNTYIIECKQAIFHGHKLIIGRVSAASEATLSS